MVTVTNSIVKKVNEIFYSLQGEGYYTGTPAVFLRLSGCNMACSFCDTQHQEGVDMTDEDIVREVLKYPARHIVITGGEPTMQLTASLTNALKQAGFFIQIETNGSIALPEGCEIDWITCSPKVKQIKIQRVDELKVLYPRKDMEDYEGIKAKEYRLQPIDSGDADINRDNVKETINYILKNPKWHLSLQTHKILNVR
jgi:organic radical activating enzyme